MSLAPSVAPFQILYFSGTRSTQPNFTQATQTGRAGIVALFWLAISFALHGTLANANNKVDISGLIEAELIAGQDFTGNHHSDIVLATTHVGMDATISERVSTHISLLYEEGETPLEIDEAYIHYKNNPFAATALKLGQLYLPFGKFETMMVSDPLTLEIGEIRKSSLLFSYSNGFNFSLFLFNGDLNEAGTANDTIDNIGLTLGYLHTANNLSIDSGIAYLNNMSETNGLGDAIITNNPLGRINKAIGGYAAHLALNWGSVTLIGELVHAMDSFKIGEIDPLRRNQPHASNLEASMVINKKLSLGLSLQHSRETAALGLPKRRILVGSSYYIDKSLRVKCEFAADRDHSIADGGTGNASHSFTLQLASEF